MNETNQNVLKMSSKDYTSRKKQEVYEIFLQKQVNEKSGMQNAG